MTQSLIPTNLFRYGLNNNIELRLLTQFENQEFEKCEKLWY